MKDRTLYLCLKTIGIILISLGVVRSQLIDGNVFIETLDYIFPTFMLCLGIFSYIQGCLIERGTFSQKRGKR